MALTPDEQATLERLHNRLTTSSLADELNLRYYLGTKRIEQLGMAIPPTMRRFMVFANWCRVYVDTIEARQQLRALILPGEEVADKSLADIFDASEMDAKMAMFNRDRMIYGRAFLSVGTNEDDKAHPYIRVESPREMVADYDLRKEKIKVAARFYGTDEPNQVTPTHATLYLPDATIWLDRSGIGWTEVARDEHRLGSVPVRVHMNRRMSGTWSGESQQTDLIPLVDSVARSLTNLQFAQEAHGIPRMFMTGVSQGDFVDAAGKPVPKFEAYFNAIHTLTKAESKVGQLEAADLKNFETAINIYSKQASTVTGFPTRYFGTATAQPPTEGTVIGDEIQLVRSVESQNREVGITVGSTAALALRFATGEWPSGRIHADWFDPATPTMAQREDALVKRRAAGVISREGYWDALGMSETQKARERKYLADEEADPVLAQILGKTSPDANVGA